MESSVAEALRLGHTALGIELGSTRIKACLVDQRDPSRVLASGSHTWENTLNDGHWSYSLDAVREGLQAAFADLAAQVLATHGVVLEHVGAIGVSAMMHGYLAFDEHGELLVPFRTWRDTTTAAAAAELSTAFGVNIPLRWSIAHLHQAMLDGEPHVPEVRSTTTLAGYVHRMLTGRNVLGIGDASGMFPVDQTTGNYDERLIARYDELAAGRIPGVTVRDLLPEVLLAGAPAGNLTEKGARLLDPSGTLHAGAFACAPEGDAGTGMVATNAVAPRTGNVSAGTSIFAMVVLEAPLAAAHDELDLVATPAGSPVAMVHCNNGASELGEWVGLFGEVARAVGASVPKDALFEVLFKESVDGDTDAGGILAYNQLSGEPIVGLAEGRPLVVRTPTSNFTLANFMRSQIYGVFATLAIGMKVLEREGVVVERLFAHGGLFRTGEVAQRMLADALRVPVSVGETASEGGAWGIAVLAAYTAHCADAANSVDAAPGAELSLSEYLDSHVFAGSALTTQDPSEAGAAGYASYLTQYTAGLAAETAAVTALR